MRRWRGSKGNECVVSMAVWDVMHRKAEENKIKTGGHMGARVQSHR